jgi:Ca2+-transporting ATPase
MKEALETSSPQRPTAAWHTLPVETVLSHLESTRSGLASAEANRRLGVYGRNELQVTRRTTAWKLLLEQCQNVLIVRWVLE